MEGDEPSIEELIEQLRLIRIQEARVIDRIERAARRAENRRATTRTRGNQQQLPLDFIVGDRVTITSALKPDQTPTGVVTRVTTGRIYITTDDGSYTWRLRKNLIKW
jgi:hypothetical protein